MIPYVEPGTHLFRFMDHRSAYFWPAIEKALSSHSLFLNSRKNFNDPFDSQPIIHDDLKSSEIRSYFFDMVQNPNNTRRSWATIANIWQLKGSGRTQLSKKQIDFIKAKSRKMAFNYLDECGLLSFSLNPENPLLWGHYAASFKGICLIFKRGASTTSALSVCAKVSYVEARPQLPLRLLFKVGTNRMMGEPYEIIGNEVFFRSYLHKDKHWEYEREARIFVPFHALKTIEFEPKELIAIILGPCATPELCKRITTEVTNRQPSVSVHQASLSKTAFKIVMPHTYLRSTQLAA